MKEGHVPERTCISCRRKANKHLLFRYVVTRDGDMILDPEQKMSGRGVYTCRDMECFEKAMTKNSFSRSLKKPVRSSCSEKLTGELLKYLRSEKEVPRILVERS